MALWEYKVITSGKGGFATPALLETYLNQLGTDEWEIIEFRTQPENPLAFSGLARRTTQRDWTLEAAAAAAARAEADKLRAEFAAKFQAATNGPSSEGAGDAAAESGTPDQDDAFRRPRDTEHDQDPYAIDDSTSDEGADEWPESDQLPTFFEAIRPHMRRNQKGPGYSVGIEFLVKKFDVLEEDLMTALRECSFEVPEDEDDKPVYVEYDGDLYWVNINRRGELWINTREKPRPVFKIVKGTRHEASEQPEAQAGRKEDQGRGGRRGDSDRRQNPSQPEPQAAEPSPVSEVLTQAQTNSTSAEGRPSDTSEGSGERASLQSEGVVVGPLPEGNALLDKLRPLMRRSRGGWSGTIGYLARALRQSDADLLQALAALGLVPSSGGDKAPAVEVGPFAYWLNRDGRGGVWINVRDAKRMRGQERGETDRPQEGEAQEAGSSPSAASESVAPTLVVESTPDQGAPAAPAPAVPMPIATEAPPSQPSETAQASPLAGLRLLLKPTRTGAFAGELGFLSSKLERVPDDLVGALVQAGLRVPEKPREKPVFVEHAAEIFWLNRNSKGELWLNAKASKFAEAGESGAASSEADSEAASEKKSRRGPRSRRRG